ncbi:hypothetical protein D3C81_1383690 [compost metagenome]
MHIQNLTQCVGHKAGGGDTGDKQIKVQQRVKSLPGPHIKQRGNPIGDQQRGDHDRKNDASCQRCAKNANGQVGGEENKRKAKGAPCGMETEDGDRQLYQIVAGCDHQQME